MTVDVMGFDLFDGNEESCADEISLAVGNDDRSCRVMACLNPHSFVVATDDAAFRSSLKASDWLIPDGIGIVWASKVLGKPMRGRVTGPDVFHATMARLDIVGGSVFFLGSTEETLEKIKKRTDEVYPRVRVVGVYSPPFKSEFSVDDNVRILSAVNAARPDVLWVGMTAPKQEKWLAAHRNSLDVNVAGAVGAVFDFFSGNVRRSPTSMQRIGLEWLHRSLTSPGRLGKRNATSNPRFMFHVLRHKLSRSRILIFWRDRL